MCIPFDIGLFRLPFITNLKNKILEISNKYVPLKKKKLFVFFLVKSIIKYVVVESKLLAKVRLVPR